MLRFSPDVLNGRIVVRLQLGFSNRVTPSQLRSAFKEIAALADIGRARLIIEGQELKNGETFRIDSVETEDGQ
ncbi:MAG: hypothetical protein PHT59_05360 [Candidatus Omnitrophica bacterium]|nr:hypothetical protein [Candidatus Omnitrophota bacterium]